ncbi:MAG: cytochrome c biogenesis protein [Fidelibacterota bacterium]
MEEDLNPERRGIITLLGVITLFFLLESFLLIMVYAPIEKTMGIVQKIFYFHVSSAWIAFLAFFVVFISSILFLIKREKRWDIMALSSAELGVFFCFIVLSTGPIWGKPVWGVWWSWEPRLTTTLVLLLIYAGYLMIRAFGGGGERSLKFAAVVGIVGFIDVPLVYFSVNWWSPEAQVHPRRISLEPEMKLVLIFSLITFTAIFLYFLMERIKLEQIREKIKILKYER